MEPNPSFIEPDISLKEPKFQFIELRSIAAQSADLVSYAKISQPGRGKLTSNFNFYGYLQLDRGGIPGVERDRGTRRVCAFGG